MNIASWAETPVLSRSAVRRRVLAFPLALVTTVAVFVPRHTHPVVVVVALLAFSIAWWLLTLAYVQLWWDGVARVCRWLQPRPWSEGRKGFVASASAGIPMLAPLLLLGLLLLIERL
jgi:hypothetical protein